MPLMSYGPSKACRTFVMLLLCFASSCGGSKESGDGGVVITPNIDGGCPDNHLLCGEFCVECPTQSGANAFSCSDDGRCVITGCSNGYAFCDNACCAFLENKEKAADTNGLDTWPAQASVDLVVDPDDVPHVIFTKEKGAALSHVYKPADWDIVTAVGTDSLVSHVVSRADSQGRIHVAYLAGGEIKYALRDSDGNWNGPELVATSNGGPGLDFAGDDTPRIAYYDPANGGEGHSLRFASNTGGSWSSSKITEGLLSQAGAFVAMRWQRGDSKGHIVYFDYTRGNKHQGELKYIMRNGDSWEAPETIVSWEDGVSAADISFDLFLDSEKKLHLIYSDVFAKHVGHVIKAENDASWSYLVIAENSHIDPEVRPFIVVDNAGIAYALYRTPYATGTTQFGVLDLGGVWGTQPLVSSSTVAAAALALDQAGAPHVAYIDINTDSLRYAY
ncbi:MAG: hypothetical protein IPJ88_02555 [Myxococcales bacterium]|nr:MAG: hypothetical protein IPJ88_02555 [Myxococcales bacterium]